MATEITYMSDVDVALVDHMGSDLSVVRSARVSTLGDAVEEEVNLEKAEGLIGFLMRERHGSVFEHNSMTFRVRAPIFVWREHHRHRVFSYNEESGRYKTLDPVFYVPADDRALVQEGKPGHYEYVPGSREQFEFMANAIGKGNAEAYWRYEAMLNKGIAREVARMVLPVNIFSTCYVTCNAHALMSFLSLRTKSEDSHFKSYPQREIEMVAEKYENIFSELFPITHAAFVKSGRVSP